MGSRAVDPVVVDDYNLAMELGGWDPTFFIPAYLFCCLDMGEDVISNKGRSAKDFATETGSIVRRLFGRCHLLPLL
jgi:hypothetical protein